VLGGELGVTYGFWFISYQNEKDQTVGTEIVQNLSGTVELHFLVRSVFSLPDLFRLWVEGGSFGRVFSP